MVQWGGGRRWYGTVRRWEEVVWYSEEVGGGGMGQ